MHMHRLFDLVVASDRSLPALPAFSRTADLTITEHAGRRAPLQQANQYGYSYQRHADGAVHVSWSDLFDFVVSPDSTRIDVHAETTWHHEPVYTYLLSQVISVALLGKAIESLHGSAVAIGERAVILLGDCGAGKSTLTAALVQAGARLLTDDLVVLRENGNRYDVAPGAFRLKLHPTTAAALRLPWANLPMEDGSGKHLYQLDADRCATTSVSACCALVLQPADRLHVQPLPAAQAVRALLAATFNPLETGAARLQQLLLHARAIAARTPVLRLQVPRSLACMDELVQTVLALR